MISKVSAITGLLCGAPPIYELFPPPALSLAVSRRTAEACRALGEVDTAARAAFGATLDAAERVGGTSGGLTGTKLPSPGHPELPGTIGPALLCDIGVAR